MSVTGRTHQHRLAVPGPPRMLGGAGNVARYVQDAVGHLTALFERYGPVVALASGGGTRIVSPYPACPGSVFVYGPELVRKVKTPHASWDIPPLTGRLYPLGEVSARKAPLKTFATGLWGVQGDEHRLHRRLLLPAFHRERVGGYADEMVVLTRSTLDRWTPGETVELHAELLRLTARIATHILFGDDGPNGQDRHGPEQTAEQIWALVASPLTRLAPYDVPGLPYRRFVNLVTSWDNQMRDMIRRKRTSASADDRDVLSTLIAATDEEGGAALTEDDLVGHVGSILGAAHETTASGLTWTLFLLSQHPAVASNLRDELEGELHGDAPTPDQLTRLPLLDRVVNESLRIIPPVPITWRIAAEPVEVGGYQLPRGTEVYASTYHTQHMPELYERPESFDPRRWESLNPSTYEYVPFGAGPRRCMGDVFAMVEMKIVLCMLLQRYGLESPRRVTVDRFGFPVVRPKRELRMVVRSKDHRLDQSPRVVSGNVREMVTLPA
jgi:cytochrome P450